MFEWQARWVQKSPKLVLAAVLAVTVVLFGGFQIQERPEVSDPLAAFLPSDSDLAKATDAIEESFPGYGNVKNVQLVGRGNVLEPGAFRTMIGLQGQILTDSEVRPFLADDPIAGYAVLLEQVLAGMGADPAAVTAKEIQTAVDHLARAPELAEANDLFNQIVARDGAGTPIAGLSLISLKDIGDDIGLRDAQLRIHDLADASSSSVLEVLAASSAGDANVIADVNSETTPLLSLVALLVIAALLIAFFRTQTDVYLTLVGLGLTVAWALGAHAWLSPGGADLLEADNIFLLVVLVLLISLSVDYALQIVGRYREALAEEGAEPDGEASKRSIGRAITASGVPVLLAAVTTAVSLFLNLTSQFRPIGEFGVIAAIGVMSGWVVMTTFVPAARLLLDRRRAAKGRALVSKPVADTVPGAERLLSLAASTVSRRPRFVLRSAIVVTILAVVAATNLDTGAKTSDFLPRGSDSLETRIFVEDSFGADGYTLIILAETDLESAASVGHLFDFSAALSNPDTRPEGVVGPPTSSVVIVLGDWATDSGQPGDNYDPAIAAAFADMSPVFTASDAQVGNVWSLLESADPAGFASVIDIRPNGPDRTILQIPVVADGNMVLPDLLDELDELWGGHPSEITATGGETLTALLSTEVARSQTFAVPITFGAALAILLLYFIYSERRPMLGLITMLPIAMVMAWLLAGMWILGIAYNISTALVMALTIGIGVDYTIHFSHRYIEAEKESEDDRQTLSSVMSTTGGALVASALTTALGLLVLAFSPLMAFQQLAILAAATILFTLVATFTALPSMLVLWSRYHRR